MTDQTTAQITQDSYALVLPQAWRRFALEATAYEKQAAELRRDLSNQADLTRAQQRQIEFSHRRFKELLVRENVNLLSTYDAVITADEDAADAAMLISAGLFGKKISRAELKTPVPLTADLIVTTFTAGDSDGAESSSVRFNDVEPPAVVELNGLRFARLMRLMSIEVRPGERFRQFLQTYFLPIESGDAAIVLQFSTINFELAKDFSQVFERIASTIKVFNVDEPTFDLSSDDPEAATGADATDPVEG